MNFKNFSKVFAATFLSLALILGGFVAVNHFTPSAKAQTSSGTLFQDVNGQNLSNVLGGTLALHVVVGSTTLSGGAATITFAGNAVFTASTSFKCVAVDTTAANAVKIVPASATTATLAGTTTDVISWYCVGN